MTDLFYIIEDNLNCELCDEKIYALDWLDQETIDSWDAQTTMEHVVYWINEHFKEKHKEVVVSKK